MTILGANEGDTVARKLFRFRGVERVVGTVRQPSAIDLAELAVKGFFHKLLGITDATQGGPIPPPSCDYWTAAKTALGTMLLNNELGDCICAEDLHLSAMRAANAGTVWVPSDAEALTLYQIVGGYVPGNSATDQGCDPMALVRYRLANPYPDGAKLLDARLVDATSDVALKQAIWLAPGTPDMILDEKDDPLELPDFFPNPDPLLANPTNDRRIPVPDYIQYHDQARELDSITARIDGYDADILDEKLEVLGRLMMVSKQLDMVMLSEDAVEQYYQEFSQGHIPQRP